MSAVTMGYRSESNISSVILGEPSRDCLTAVGIGVGSGGGGGCVLLEKSSVPLLSLNSSVEVTANGSRIVSAGLLNPYHVSEEVVSQWAGILSITLLLLSCLIGNGLLVSFVCRKGSGIQTRKGMRVRNLEQLVGLIAVVSIVNGSMLCLFQIASMIQSSEPSSSSSFGRSTNDALCKVLGLASNLMSLLVIWYEALLGFERYLKFVKPQEYGVTFSKTNLQIILFGILLVLLAAVSGPIYGWGNYAYVKEIHACSFDLRAPNAITYFVMSTLSYVVTPYIIMAFSCISIMFNSGVCDDRHHAHSPTFPAPSWNVVQQKDVVLPLTLTMVTSFSLQLPKYVSEIERALDPQLRMPSRFLFTATWLQTFAVNCCFACLLLLCHAFRACMGSEALYFIPWDSRAASDKDG